MMLTRTAAIRLATVARSAAASQRQLGTNVAKFAHRARPNYSHLGLTAVALIGLGAAFAAEEPYSSDVNVFNETPESIETSISVDKGIRSFPKYIKAPLQGENELAGYGVRTVTFLRMKVYGLGIYVNREDVPKIPAVLDSRFLSTFYEKLGDETKNLSHREKLSLALADPELSIILIENLLDAQVRFTANIIPLRNTDFNHLRDGLIKSIMACPKSKQILQENNDSLPLGLDELRKAFGARKGSCPKGHSLYLEMQKDQSIIVRYQELNSKTNAVRDHILGEVKEPLVSKLLFLQYMSGPNPLCQQAKETSVASIVSHC